MILSGELQKYTGTPIMNYYTCKLFSDMGYYEDIYDYVKEKGGPYFEMLTAEIESKSYRIFLTIFQEVFLMFQLGRLYLHNASGHP